MYADIDLTEIDRYKSIKKNLYTIFNGTIDFQGGAVKDLAYIYMTVTNKKQFPHINISNDDDTHYAEPFIKKSCISKIKELPDPFIFICISYCLFGYSDDYTSFFDTFVISNGKIYFVDHFIVWWGVEGGRNTLQKTVFMIETERYEKITLRKKNKIIKNKMSKWKHPMKIIDFDYPKQNENENDPWQEIAQEKADDPRQKALIDSIISYMKMDLYYHLGDTIYISYLVRIGMHV